MTAGKVKSVRLDAASRRGLTKIVRLLIDDFDNAFNQLFPDASDRDIMEISAAIEYLEQFVMDGVYE